MSVFWTGGYAAAAAVDGAADGQRGHVEALVYAGGGRADARDG